MTDTPPVRRMYIHDNLPVLRGINSETVDLIYLDPPFNSNADYAAPIGSKAAGAAFKDTWTLDDLDREWVTDIQAADPKIWAACTAAQVHSDSRLSYIVYMAVRLIEMRRVLKPTGSIYLHCDPTASHYLKLLMDAVFGRKNFRNEIVWRYPKYSPGTKAFGRDYDQIFFYAMSPKVRITPQTVKRDKPVKQLVRENVGGVLKNKRDPVTGKVMYRTSTTKNVASVWDISIVMPASKERTGWPTQKPLKLLRRIIRASSSEGDLVLDPFAGCATTCVAAEQLGRQWIGIDIADQAAAIIVDRLQQASDDGALLRTGLAGLPDIEVLHKPPTRTDPQAPGRSRNIKQLLYEAQDGTCIGCAERLPIRYFEVDHIRPTSKGGQDVDNNLQLLCGPCNRVKGNRTMAYLLERV